MPHFIYKARDNNGLAVTGSVEAENEVLVGANLYSLGYKVIHIEKKTFQLKHSFQFF